MHLSCMKSPTKVTRNSSCNDVNDVRGNHITATKSPQVEKRRKCQNVRPTAGLQRAERSQQARRRAITIWVPPVVRRLAIRQRPLRGGHRGVFPYDAAEVPFFRAHIGLCHGMLKSIVVSVRLRVAAKGVASRGFPNEESAQRVSFGHKCRGLIRTDIASQNFGQSPQNPGNLP